MELKMASKMSANFLYIHLIIDAYQPLVNVNILNHFASAYWAIPFHVVTIVNSNSNSIQIQKGLLKHIHIYSNHTQYDNIKVITNIKYPL